MWARAASYMRASSSGSQASLTVPSELSANAPAKNASNASGVELRKLASPLEMRPRLFEGPELCPPPAGTNGEIGTIARRQVTPRYGHDRLPSPEAGETAWPGRLGQQQRGGAG